MFVMNAWYVAAWSHEVIGAPVRRMICELPIVLFRRMDGTAVALADRCAHRGFPLSAGRVIDDTIECGYHGFQFGCDGVCTKVPAQERIPRGARVAAYPVVERDGWIWIWTGDPDLADEGGVPDTHWMSDPAWACNYHSVEFACRAELIHDNLLDLTHESFIHTTTVGDDYIYEHGITVEVDGDVTTVDRLMPDVEAPPLYADTMGIDGLWDRYHTTVLYPPGYLLLHSGITGQGKPREEGFSIKVLNGITPIDAHTSHYYYCFARNFAVDDDAATADLQRGLGIVLEEDAEAMRLQEIGVQQRPDGMRDVLIAQDAGIGKARKIMARLLAAEA